MVLTVKASLIDAEHVKKEVLKKELFLDGYKYAKEKGYIYFPVAAEYKSAYKVTFQEYELAEEPVRYSLKEQLEGVLTAAELEHLKTSFDTVGSIALIEIDEELLLKEELIAETLLENNKQIKTVLKKEGGHEGELRLQKYAFLAGEDTRETIVQENGIRLKINVESVYYSVRSATERNRIASLVKKGERVLVMFSGAGPYVCVIAKKTEAAEVMGIELNEAGHELAVENARLNKLQNAVLVQGDVKEVVPALQEKGITFDRIIMPLPHTGEDFLDEAFLVAEKGTVIHLYDFEKEGEFEKAAAKAEAGAARNKRKIKILGVTPSGQHSPRTFRVCADLLVEN